MASVAPREVKICGEVSKNFFWNGQLWILYTGRKLKFHVIVMMNLQKGICSLSHFLTGHFEAARK